ncbi:hypothetical protein [Streptomyces sp. NPDC053427]|uniref:hypothetical protein n=1 Tax=Streptomyces sp. NPDC053427 TaxID=3365701 RepID=UPI0037D01A90
MPLRAEDVRVDLACGTEADGRRRGWYLVRVRAEALRPLGLHPDQPASKIVGPARPPWWYAAAARAARDTT